MENRQHCKTGELRNDSKTKRFSVILAWCVAISFFVLYLFFFCSFNCHTFLFRSFMCESVFHCIVSSVPIHFVLWFLFFIRCIKKISMTLMTLWQYSLRHYCHLQLNDKQQHSIISRDSIEHFSLDFCIKSYSNKWDCLWVDAKIEFTKKNPQVANSK